MIAASAERGQLRKKRKEELHGQRNHSLHQLRKGRHIGGKRTSKDLKELAEACQACKLNQKQLFFFIVVVLKDKPSVKRARLQESESF